ncbi:metal ABC transporter permease, partial [Leuconostoc pseudomesenteroides]
MFEYTFMQYAFIASFFISLICAVMGVFVVARKTAFYT